MPSLQLRELQPDLGLAGDADEVTGWGLELVKLEALAREGLGDDTLAQLEKLAGMLLSFVI